MSSSRRRDCQQTRPPKVAGVFLPSSPPRPWVLPHLPRLTRVRAPSLPLLSTAPRPLHPPRRQEQAWETMPPVPLRRHQQHRHRRGRRHVPGARSLSDSPAQKRLRPTSQTLLFTPKPRDPHRPPSEPEPSFGLIQECEGVSRNTNQRPVPSFSSDDWTVWPRARGGCGLYFCAPWGLGQLRQGCSTSSASWCPVTVSSCSPCGSFLSSASGRRTLGKKPNAGGEQDTQFSSALGDEKNK